MAGDGAEQRLGHRDLPGVPVGLDRKREERDGAEPAGEVDDARRQGDKDLTEHVLGTVRSLDMVEPHGRIRSLRGTPQDDRVVDDHEPSGFRELALDDVAQRMHQTDPGEVRMLDEPVVGLPSAARRDRQDGLADHPAIGQHRAEQEFQQRSNAAAGN